MAYKWRFGDFGRHILNGQVRLIQNSWIRVYRIKIVARRSKNMTDEDIKDIEDNLFLQCEQLMRVAVEICEQIDIPLEILGGKLCKELDWADNIDENGIYIKPEPPDADGWHRPPFGYDDNPNGPKGTLVRTKQKHFIFDWRSYVTEIPDKNSTKKDF